MNEVNWAGNHRYPAEVLHRPATLDQLRAVVAAAPSVHVLGSRHSFNAIADARELVSLDALPADLAVDAAAGTVSFTAGLRYGDLATALAEHDLALHNLASLPHISVAGAVATATHGSGDANGNLATAVAALELLTSEGDIVTVRRGEPDFDGMVVHLGALGVVTRLTVDVEPVYDVRQRVFQALEWDALFEHYDEITAAGYSVSVFSRWGETTEQVWVKSRVTDAPEEVRGDLFGAPAATDHQHPILGLDPVNCCPQLGIAGRWSDRLPHFRMGFTPSVGEELQSEFHLPRQQAVPAMRALRELSAAIRPLNQVTEFRTIAADGLWMSPQYERDTTAFHFTWVRDQPAVEALLDDIEQVLAPFGARPHWGKLFRAEAPAIAPLYPRHADFVALMERLDPRGAFRNDWLESRVLGTRSAPASGHAAQPYHAG